MGARRATAADFWKYVDRTGECWLWQGARKQTGLGYGQIHRQEGGNIYAHRFAYELEVGPIPDGMTIDHLCRTPACVRPTHLEPVTVRENLRRGTGLGVVNAQKTHCPKGHEYDLLNTRFYRGERNCRACDRLRRANR
jgi:hypothetical protein